MKKILNELCTVLKWVLYIVIACFCTIIAMVLIVAVISVMGEIVIYFIENPILQIN